MSEQTIVVLTEQQLKDMFPGATEAGYETREMKALLLIVDAVAEAIRDLGSVPSGHLYAMLQGMMGLDTYLAIIVLLKRAKLVSESNHLLTWIGPNA